MRFLKVFVFLSAIAIQGFAPYSAYAQEAVPKAGFGIEANLLAGKVLKHNSKFQLPIPNLSTAADISFVQQTYGRKDWHKRRHYPLAGIGITYTRYGIDSIYGRCISLNPFLQIPIIRGRKLEWTMRVGFGLGYVTKDYERAPSWDTINNAIGSHINNFSLFMTDARYHINEHWDVQAGGNFQHLSNASLTQPNLGVNMYGAHVGVRYYPTTSKPKLLDRALPKLTNRILLQARLGFAMNGYAAPEGPAFPVYLASVYASRRYHNKNKVFAGIDYSYHTAIYAFLRDNEIDPGSEKSHSYKSAVFAGNEFLFGRVGIMLQVGVYLKQAYLKQDPYYEKLGGNFYLVQKEHGPVKELFLSALLKTHKSVAELAEVGVGVGF